MEAQLGTAGEWEAVREGASAARAAIAHALLPDAAEVGEARAGQAPRAAIAHCALQPAAGAAEDGAGAGREASSSAGAHAHAGRASGTDATDTGARGKKGKGKKLIRGQSRERDAAVAAVARAVTSAATPLELSEQPHTTKDGAWTVQTLAQAHRVSAAARALSWKERIKRRLSHSTEEQTEATLLKVESECPNCRHVICTEECLDMSTMRDALTMWMKQVVHRASVKPQTFKRAGSSASNSSKSASSAHAESHHRLSRASSLDSSAHTDEDLADDYTSSEDEMNTQRAYHSKDTPRRRKGRGSKTARRNDAAAPIQQKRAKTGTAERLMHPAPEHRVGRMDGEHNDGGEPLLTLDTSDVAQKQESEQRARRIASDRVQFNNKVVVFLRKERHTILPLRERRQSSLASETVVLEPFYVPMNCADTTLVFESRFESGNLFRATQVGTYEYDLHLCSDWNTSTHIQWFYFAVSNTRRSTMYRLNIINMLKPVSMYGKGLRPLMYSAYAAAKHGLGWHRTGSNISYYTNGAISKRTRDDGSSVKLEYLRTLSFDVEFPANNDTSYLAHCFPYTFTDLQGVINDLQAADHEAMARRAAAAAVATPRLLLEPPPMSAASEGAASAETAPQTSARGGAGPGLGAASTASPPVCPEAHKARRTAPNTAANTPRASLANVGPAAALPAPSKPETGS